MPDWLDAWVLAPPKHLQWPSLILTVNFTHFFSLLLQLLNCFILPEPGCLIYKEWSIPKTKQIKLSSIRSDIVNWSTLEKMAVTERSVNQPGTLMTSKGQSDHKRRYQRRKWSTRPALLINFKRRSAFHLDDSGVNRRRMSFNQWAVKWSTPSRGNR